MVVTTKTQISTRAREYKVYVRSSDYFREVLGELGLVSLQPVQPLEPVPLTELMVNEVGVGRFPTGVSHHNQQIQDLHKQNKCESFHTGIHHKCLMYKS